MRIIDIIKNCPYKKIEDKIKMHYGTKELKDYKKLYYRLKSMNIDTTHSGDLYVYIIAYKESEDDEDIKIDDFDENDTSLYYDVSGYTMPQKKVYSISSSYYSDFLQYKIDEETLKKFSPETILAHCFWEITAYGFDEIPNFL